MAKYTLFGWNQYGELAYRKTGQTVSKNYTVRGNTVYGEDGRKVGTVGKGTAAQQRRIRNAASSGGRKAARTPGRFSFRNISKARRKALRTPGVKLVTPMPTKDEIRNFGRSVKNMALYSQETDPTITQKIRAMKDENIMTLYREQEMIFDVYFDYGGIKDDPTGRRGSRETAKNAQALIDTYEQRFGAITLQSRLT